MLDIRQFTKIIIKCVLYYNNFHCLSGYDKLPEMIADEIPAIPAELWAWGIANRSGTLRTFPADTVKINLLPSDMATVTAYGIRYYGCLYYSCRTAVEQHWFEKARQQRSWKIRISYEPRYMDQVYIHGDTKTPFLPCELTDRSRHYRGKTLWEIDQMRQADRRQQDQNESEAFQARLNLTKDVKDIVAEADIKRDKGLLWPESDRKKVQCIRDNRQQERNDIQKFEAFRLSDDGETPDHGENVILSGSDSNVDDEYCLPSAQAIRQLNKKESDND
jgi:hypothetical protein